MSDTQHQAVDHDEQPVEIIPTVAGPRTMFSREVYMGGELRNAPARPGALDAARLPSLFNGRTIQPSDLRAMITAPAAPWAPPKAAPAQRPSKPQNIVFASGAPNPLRHESDRRFMPVDLPPKPKAARQPPKPKAERTHTAAHTTYKPYADSLPSRVLAHLQAHGGHLTFPEAARMGDASVRNVTATFAKAFSVGALIRLRIDGRSVIALPGYVPPQTGPSRQRVKLQALLEAKRLVLNRARRDIAEIEAQLRTTP